MCENVCKKLCIAVLILLRYDQHWFSNISNSKKTSISPQQAVAECWDLPTLRFSSLKMSLLPRLEVVGAKKSANIVNDAKSI
jgi:hypothetical protein